MPENQVDPVTPPAKSRRPFFWGNIGVIISGFAAGILIAMILFVSYALLAINHRLANGLTQLANQVNNVQTAMTEAQKTAVNAEQTMEQALKTQSQTIDDIQKNQRTNKDDFLLGEAYYLLKVAHDGLQYERNVQLAIKLLQSADQSIAKISDPKAYPIREALAADIVALQSAPQVDIAGIYAQLTALNEQMDKLPLLSELSNHAATQAAAEADIQASWWRRGLSSLKQAFDRIVVVRKNLPNSLPLIAPDQQVYLYQNLHAEIEKVQWALLHHQPEIYRLSLLQAEQWIKQFAQPDSPITKQLLQNLTQLQQIDINPATPDIVNSLQALQNYQTSLGK